MRKLILIFTIILATEYSSGQGQGVDKKWLLGYGCCSGLFHSMDLDFSTGNLVLSQPVRQMWFNTTIGEISDPSNNLLFYTNGIYIANALDDTMQNGNGINPSQWTSSHSNDGLNIPQGCLILPFPDDSTKYYLFHQTIDENLTKVSLHLYCSIIDMTLNGGLGAVVQKNISIISDSLVPGRITACKHSNGRDWWVIVHQYQTSNAYIFLVTPNGIQNPRLENMLTYRSVMVGQSLFSVQGNKFAYYEPINDLDIWDFDRCSGLFSNLIHINLNDTSYSGGLAFSPNSRFLYVTSTNYIYQFDLSANNVDSSRTIIGVYDGYQTQGFYTNFYLMALAPDGKIYINCANSTTALHVINNPDSIGLACGLCQHCISLPAYNAFTFPNFPNYFLGAEGGSICDSLPTNITSDINKEKSFALFPNPTNKDLYFEIKLVEPNEILLTNSLGQKISLPYEIIKNEYLHLDVTSLENGIYFVSFWQNDKRIVRRFVKE